MKHRSMFYALCFFLLSIAPLSAQQYSESNDFSYALKLYNEGFYDIAAQQFSTFINRYPASDNMGDARYYYADSYYKLGEIDNARIEFQGLAVGFPDHPRAAEGWLRVGECYEELGKPMEAAKAFETIKILYSSSPLAPRGLLHAGRLYLESGEPLRAEQTLKEFLDRYVESSEYPQGRAQFGTVLLAKGELEHAIKEFERVPALTQDKEILSTALLGKGQAMYRLGLISRATESFNGILSNYIRSSSAAEALTQLVRIHQNKREYTEALSLIRKHASSFSGGKQATAISMLESQCLILQKNPSQAVRMLEPIVGSASLTVKEKTLSTYYLACAYLEDGSYDKAQPLYEALLNDADAKTKELRVPILINLSSLHLDNNRIALARPLVHQLQEEHPGSPDNESIHRELIKKAFKQQQISVGVDELQRYRGAYPASASRDDLTHLAGKAYFENEQYQRSLLFFEQVLAEYPGSAVWDSSRAYIRYIKTYEETGEQAGVKELAKLMGRMITGEKKEQLIFDLGEVYISRLKDFEAAANIFSQPQTAKEDSATTAKRLYYLSESKLLLAEKELFLSSPSEKSYAEAASELKKAMVYINQSPQPDTLMFRYLKTTLAADTPIDKFLQFWTVFEQNYPQSNLLAEAYLHIARKANISAKASIANTYFDKAIAKGGYFGGTAALFRGKELLQNGDRANGESVLKTFLLENKRHPGHPEAYWLLSQSSLTAGEKKTSAAFLERLAEEFNYTEYGAQAPVGVIASHIADGNYEKAAQKIQYELRGVSVDDPVAASYLSQPEPAYYFYAGKSAWRQKNFGRSRRELLAYLNRAQKQEFQNESLYLLGMMAIEEQDIESALLHFELVNKDGDATYYQQATLEAAKLLYDNRRFEESLGRYQSLTAFSQPALRMDAEAMMVRNLIQLGRSKEASAAIKKYNSSYKKQAGLNNYLASFEYEKGRKAFTEKSYDRALNSQKNVLKKYKKSDYADDANYFIARIQTTMNRTKDALKTLDQFQKNYPNSELQGNAYLTRAEIHFRDEQEDLGLAAVKKAVELASTPAVKRSSLSLLVNTYHNMGLWDGALQKTREYIALYPKASDIMSKKISIGIFLSRANRYSEALDYLQKIKYEVGSQEEPEVQFYIGEALYNAGQYDRAINEFLKIPLLSQKTKLQWEASALYFAGQSYEKLNRPQDAIRMYEEITSRPGIQVELKREARNLISKLRKLN
ncbi:MAG: tetratricopeptide repeat protein [Calditrichia bacterium]